MGDANDAGGSPRVLDAGAGREAGEDALTTRAERASTRHGLWPLLESSRTDERKRKRLRRRGWLIRRGLLAADVSGIVASFFLAELLSAQSHLSPGRVVAFLLTLPGWIVLAKLYGLYDRDDARTAHSTVDDVVGVFHLVTVGTWGGYAVCRVTDVAQLDVNTLVTFWL